MAACFRVGCRYWPMVMKSTPAERMSSIDRFGGDASKLAIAGDSAGGNLAAAAASLLLASGVGTNDFLYADNVRFAEALNAAGVPVVLRSFPGLTHGFFSYGNVSKRADAAAALMVEDLRRVLALRTAAAVRP